MVFRCGDPGKDALVEYSPTAESRFKIDHLHVRGLINESRHLGVRCVSFLNEKSGWRYKKAMQLCKLRD